VNSFSHQCPSLSSSLDDSEPHSNPINPVHAN
jgi:hypothetical protein